MLSSTGDKLRKVVIAGDSTSGKSCLVLRYVENTFTLSHTTTVGIDFRTKMINKGEESVKLQIWDTAGQERFRAMASSYFRSAHGVIIAFDVTNEATFKGIESWHRQVKNDAPEDSIVILIGNKIDQEGRLVSREQAEALADSLEIEEYFETSAKSGEGVEHAFTTLADYALGIKKSRFKKTRQNSISPTPATFISPHEVKPIQKVPEVVVVGNLAESEKPAAEAGGFNHIIEMSTIEIKHPDKCEKCPAKSKIAKPHLLRRELEVGVEYLYCTCGFASKVIDHFKDNVQPWCDDTCHKDPNIKGWEPLKFKVDKEQKYYALCGCKRSKSGPFCDGSHSEIDVEDCMW
ncbi:Ras-like GTP-binding protein Rab [Acrasis kona]|uniref:Ras-like GTP-binding protein Rab n=1 Tax=Acrasis kona TaxID=1008807 RepID=A0AAW2YMQ4_9EUKA